MAVRKADITPRKRQHARHLYECTTTPATRIAAGLGISPRTLKAWATAWAWGSRPGRAATAVDDVSPGVSGADVGRPPDIEPPASLVPAPAPPAASQPASDAATAMTGEAGDPALQVERTVERELAAIEAILARLGEGEERAALAERTARTLASLTRTLAAVRRLRAVHAEGADAAAEVDADDDMPRDIDEFRRELARRIDAFVAGGADAEISRERGE